MANANIYVVLDGSGSMNGVKHDVVKGINKFIEEQKDDALAKGDDVRFSLTTFDDNVMEVYIDEDIDQVNDLDLSKTYLGGSTALLDAIGRTLTTAKLAQRNLLVIYTDGGENASHEFAHEDVEKLLKDFSAKGQVIYLGAEFADFKKDQGYATVSRGAGVHYNTLNTSKKNVGATWSAVSGTASYYRGASAAQVNDNLIAGASAAGVDWEAVKEDENE